MAEAYSSTIDTTNFARIVRCILGPCTEMLRNILEREVAPSEIKERVRNVSYLRRNLTFHQKNRLCINDTFNMDPDYTKFDISLMYRLLRTKEICSNINVPSKCWGMPPSADETSLGDDIERIRILKSDICSHPSFPSINYAKYCRKMEELKEVALRFGVRLQKPLHFYRCICEIENMAMDAEIATLYTKLLVTIEDLQKEQNDGILIIYEKVSDIQRQLEKLQTTTDVLPDVRPAACLYPERILARKDDIKIKRNYSYLLEQIDPMVILEQVYKKGIISSTMKEEISECNRRKQRTDRLLKSLLRSHPELYNAFIEVLNDPIVKCGHIVKKLESTSTEENQLSVIGRYQEMFTRLISNKRRICDEVNTDEIIHCFLEHEVLTLDEHSKIFYGQYRLTKIEMLIEKIRLYLPWSYQIFIESLGIYRHYETLVKQLEETDVNQVQTGGSRLQVLGVEKALKDSKITHETDAAIIIDVEADNAAQVHDEIVSKSTWLEVLTDVIAALLHGIVTNIGLGSIKITLTPASRLFWKKLKKVCDSEEIGDFIRDLIATEDVNLSLLPEDFTVHFKIHIPPHTQAENTKDTKNTKIQSNLVDSYSFLQQEINCRVLVEDLLKAGVIDNKEVLLCSEDPLKDLLQFLNANGPSRLDRFISVLQRAGYSYVATVLLESNVEYFDSISDDDIRIAMYDNYTMLLDELDFDQLVKASSLLRTRCTFILQKSDISRKNKIRLLLKEMVQGQSNGLRAFLKSLNYAGYQHILYILQETSKRISTLEDNSDDEGPVSKPIVLEGQIKMQKIRDMPNLSEDTSDNEGPVSKPIAREGQIKMQKISDMPNLSEDTSDGEGPVSKPIAREGQIKMQKIRDMPNLSEDTSDDEGPVSKPMVLESQIKMQKIRDMPSLSGSSKEMSYEKEELGCRKGENEDTEQEKLKLREDILKMCEKSRQMKKPQVIALIGLHGVGKSSFINTLAAALSDEWHEYAYTGSHGGSGEGITGFYKSYKKEEYLNESTYNNTYMPTLIDIPGFQNENTEKQEEVLRLIFYGCLKEEESSKSVYKYYDNYGASGLRQEYSRRSVGLQVSRVIFLASANEDIPKSLIKCVIKAARPSGVIPSGRKIVLPIFGVLTKCDKVDFDNTEIQQREEEFINAVGLGGSKNRYMRCENYCDAVCDKYDPKQSDNSTRDREAIFEIDMPILKFLKQVLDPAYNIVGDEEKYYILLGYRGYILNTVGRFQWPILVALIMILIGAFVAIFFPRYPEY